MEHILISQHHRMSRPFGAPNNFDSSVASTSLSAHFPLRQNTEAYYALVRETVDGNSVLPATEEAKAWGDPYEIGDIYEASPYVQEWELSDSVKRPYLSHIKAVSSAWPHLRYLADWMEVTTAPAKWKLIKDKEAIIRPERASRTKVAVVDFSPGAGTQVQTITQSDQLATKLREHTAEDVSRLYIVEDLSRDVIEVLGSELDIDPLFFREQISDYWWYNCRDPWVELPDLQVIARGRNFFQLRYLQTRYFKNNEQYVAATREAGKFNVLRRLDRDKNHNNVLDEKGACVGLVRSRVSFWWKPAEAGKCGAVGVLLVDPPIEGGFTLWGGYRNFLPTPSISIPGPFQTPPRTSVFDSLAYWCQHTSQSDIDSMGADPRVMLLHISQIICAEWLILCQYITARLAQIEWELETPYFRADPKDIDPTLHKLHPWRRSVPLYKKCVDDMIIKLYDEDPAPPRCIESLRADMNGVQRSIAELQVRIERIVAVATAVISIEESRRAANLNQYLGRLTYLAVIFAPLSFVTSFFSMQPDITQLTQTIWIYFCVAIPLAAAAFLIIDFERLRASAKRLLHRLKQERDHA